MTADYRDFYWISPTVEPRRQRGFVRAESGWQSGRRPFKQRRPARVESFIGVYDEAWAAYGPGQIVTEYGLRWAFERGLDFDFRIGAEHYKYEWATRTSTVTTFSSHDLARLATWQSFTGTAYRSPQAKAGARAFLSREELRRTLVGGAARRLLRRRSRRSLAGFLVFLIHPERAAAAILVQIVTALGRCRTRRRARKAGRSRNSRTSCHRP